MAAMPTRKQRRRQEKNRRHEWEEVWVDDDGNEIETPPDAPAPAPRKADKPKPRASSSRGGRPVRQVPPPSWNKVLRRGAMFAPVMFILVYYLQKSSHRSLWAAIFQTAVLLVRLERDERPGARVEPLAVALDAHLAVDHQDERVLLHLVLAELLPRLEHDQHRAPLLLRVEHDRRDRAARRVDRRQIPSPHGRR